MKLRLDFYEEHGCDAHLAGSGGSGIDAYALNFAAMAAAASFPRFTFSANDGGGGGGGTEVGGANGL
jgi:hypothetical protein